jgi:hypothetical protein
VDLETACKLSPSLTAKRFYPGPQGRVEIVAQLGGSSFAYPPTPESAFGDDRLKPDKIHSRPATHEEVMGWDDWEPFGTAPAPVAAPAAFCENCMAAKPMGQACVACGTRGCEACIRQGLCLGCAVDRGIAKAPGGNLESIRPEDISIRI